MCRCMNISFPAEAGPSVLQSPTRSRSRSRPGATSVRGKPLRYLQRAGGPSEWQLVPAAIYLRCAVRSSQIGRSFSRAASPHRVPKPKSGSSTQRRWTRPAWCGSGSTRAKAPSPNPEAGFRPMRVTILRAHALDRRRRGVVGAERRCLFSPPNRLPSQNDRRNCRRRQFRCVPVPREACFPLPSPPLTRPREAAGAASASQRRGSGHERIPGRLQPHHQQDRRRP